MIKLIPLEDTQALNTLCAAYDIECDKNTHAYISASEDLKAQCIFTLNEYNVQLLVMDFDDTDPLIAEMLIRAVGAFAANRSGYLFHIRKDVGQAIASTLKTMGFEELETEYCGKVPVILKGHCCHNDKNN